MSATQWIGLGLVLAPVTAFIVATVIVSGWRTAVAVWGGAIAICIFIATGIYLLKGGTP